MSKLPGAPGNVNESLNNFKRDNGRTMTIAADGTVKVTMDLNGEVRAQGKWSIDGPTLKLHYPQMTIDATKRGNKLYVRILNTTIDQVVTTTWTQIE